MKKEWQSVRIGDREYAFEMLPADRGVVMSMQVVEAFGGLFSALIPLANKEGGIENVASMQNEFAMAAAAIKPEKSKAIIDAMLPTVFVHEGASQGRRCTYNDFNGRILELYKVMFYAIRYNFADFFAASLPNGVQIPGARDA